MQGVHIILNVDTHHSECRCYQSEFHVLYGYYVIMCLFVQHEESSFGLCIWLQLLIAGWCFQNCSLQASLLHTYYINKIS